MPRYAVKPELMLSGDLRANIAMRPEYADLMAELIKFDDLIVAEAGPEHKGTRLTLLGYRKEVTQHAGEFQQRIQQADDGSLASWSSTVSGKRLPSAGRFRLQTGLLVGSSATRNAELVQLARDNGFVVMAVGHGLTVPPGADIWFGGQPVSDYDGSGILRPNIWTLLPAERADESLWNAVVDRFHGQKAREYPNVTLLNIWRGETGTKEEWVSAFFANPRPTDFGIDSSFFSAVTTMICLGFTNIVFTGFDLGGELDKFYYFPEIPSAAALRRKTEAYVQIKRLFPAFQKLAADNGVRFYACPSAGLPMMQWPVGAMKAALAFAANPWRMQINPKRTSPPLAEKNRRVQLHQELTKASLSIAKLAERIPTLMERLPGRFATEEMNKSWTEYKAAVGKGGCGGCSIGKFLRPFYLSFLDEATAHTPAFEELWRELFPDQYVLVMGDRFVFRGDHAELEMQWASAQKVKSTAKKG